LHCLSYKKQDIQINIYIYKCLCNLAHLSIYLFVLLLCRSSPDGSIGKQFREQIELAIQKLQEPTQGKQIKPLTAPDSNKKKTRRGKKSRRLKEMTTLSELQKKRNRLKFATDAEEEIDQQFGAKGGLALLSEGSGTLRLEALTKKVAKSSATGGSKPTVPDNETASGSTIYSGSATQLRTGLASSLAFTPAQGIALENPINAQKRLQQQSGNVPTEKKRYFSSLSFFKEPQQPADNKKSR
jgi:U4/U6 small nuclear ribonucleoprotein PRP31